MNPYLLPVLDFGPLVMRRLIDQIEDSRLDEKTAPGRFSAREVIAHCADWEPIMLARIHQTVSNPGSSVEVYDEGEMAIAHGYAESDIEQQQRSFVERRRATVDYLRNLPEAEWAKSVVHPERGVMTVLDQANMLLGHDMYHLEQLSGLLGEKTVSTW